MGDPGSGLACAGASVDGLDEESHDCVVYYWQGDGRTREVRRESKHPGGGSDVYYVRVP